MFDVLEAPGAGAVFVGAWAVLACVVLVAWSVVAVRVHRAGVRARAAKAAEIAAVEAECQRITQLYIDRNWTEIVRRSSQPDMTAPLYGELTLDAEVMPSEATAVARPFGPGPVWAP